MKIQKNHSFLSSDSAVGVILTMTISRTAFVNSGFPQTSSMAESSDRSGSVPKNLCTLRWRQDKLWVNRVAEGPDRIVLPALAKPEWFRSCLIRSNASAVCVDPALGPQAIKMWAEACHGAQKSLYLRLPKYAGSPRRKQPIAWFLKRLFDYGVAAVAIVLLSPLMLAIAAFIWVEDKGPVLSYQWRLGQGGRLFRAYQFRSQLTCSTDPADAVGVELPAAESLTSVGGWLKRTHLNLLPMLINVLQGEVSLVGPHPWSIYDLAALPATPKVRLNVLPGIAGT
ncbi:UDP-phosphate galactose phosphotransferase [filamentous cyanobacterium CCP5]|nr:UDP-phosphate galactose phosphotransferase [filamentous cyanobacterium CCP5]